MVRHPSRDVARAENDEVYPNRHEQASAKEPLKRAKTARLLVDTV